MVMALGSGKDKIQTSGGGAGGGVIQLWRPALLLAVGGVPSCILPYPTYTGKLFNPKTLTGREKGP